MTSIALKMLRLVRLNASSYKDGAERHLRKQAFQVLLYLVQQHERAVGREELIRIVWQGSAVTDDSLGQCISEIREALGDSSRHPRYIKTLPKIGYQFIGAVNDRVMNGPAEPEPGLLERQSYSPEGALHRRPGGSHPGCSDAAQTALCSARFARAICSFAGHAGHCCRAPPKQGIR